MTTTATKTCADCRAQRPAADFWADPRARDGLVSSCRECITRRRKERKGAASPERLAEIAEIRRRISRRHGQKESALLAARRSPGQKHLRKFVRYIGALKVCQRCGVPQATSGFTKSRQTQDGFAAWCRTCTQANSRRWRETDPVKAREISRRAGRKYAATPRGRARAAIYKARHPRGPVTPASPEQAKKRAHYRVAAALRDGRLTKPDECQRCGHVGGTTRASSLIAHHARGYEGAAALDVDWLCRRCHGEVHRVDNA